MIIKLDKKLTIITAFLMILSTQAFAVQQCDGSSVTTDDEDFVISEDEPSIVTHSTTGLSWSRCLVGQVWNNDDETCDGTGKQLTWQEALQLSSSYELEQKTGWRVPNIKELVSIVERNCVLPSANLTIFDNTPAQSFWSSSPNTAAGQSNEAWAVSFSNGRLDSKLKQQDFYVRMVKYAE
jgi:hypothetical protein